jgi:O-antigen ligase
MHRDGDPIAVLHLRHPGPAFQFDRNDHHHMTKNSIPSALLLALFLAGALVVGAAAAVLSPGVAIGIVVALAGATAIFWDFRIGVTIAMCLAPISSANILLKIYAAVVILSLMSYLLTQGREERSHAALPKAFIWLYCVPFFVAYAVALTQIDIPFRAMKDPVNREIYTYYGYFAELLLPAFSHVCLALLLANAIRSSQKKEYWLAIYCVAAMIASSTFVIALVTSGYEITVLERDRNIEMFFTHANDWGALLGTVSGILLFITALGRGKIRLLAMLALGFSLVGLALAFSRGGYLLFLVVVFGLFLVGRRIKLIIGMVVVAFAASFMLPDAVIERATTGLDPRTISSAEGGSMNDPLTAGRGGVFLRIIPEILNSPIVGRGLGSMAFTDTYVSGRLNMTNPHNLYVETLLDTGAVGLLLFAIWSVKFFKICRQTIENEATPEIFSVFLKGLLVAFIGLLVNGATNGHWYPSREQSFLWMGFGVLLGFWQRQAQVAPEVQASAPMPGKVRAYAPNAAWQNRLK